MTDKFRGKHTSKQKHSGAQWSELIPSITQASWPVSSCQNMFNGDRKSQNKVLNLSYNIAHWFCLNESV